MQKNSLDYPVEFADDAFGASSVLAEALRKVTGSETPRVMMVADLNVVQRNGELGAKIGSYFQNNGITLLARPVIVGGGEKAKVEHAQNVQRIAQALIEAKPEANDCVIALGGGTLFDLVGYVVAQIAGSCRMVRMPTTPAAMIDAAFSEYSSVDFPDAKDAMRLAVSPAAVIIDTSFANTVLDGVWRGGFSEAVRLAVAKNSALFKRLVELLPSYVARDSKALREIVESSVALRQKKGGTDFGLWSAERLEEMSGFKLPHGYALAIGMCLDSAYSKEKGLFKEKDREVLIKMLADSGILEGVRHSRPLLGLVDKVLAGLHRWRRRTGSAKIVVLSGLGKSCDEESPDFETYSSILKKYTEPATES